MRSFRCQDIVDDLPSVSAGRCGDDLFGVSKAAVVRKNDWNSCSLAHLSQRGTIAQLLGFIAASWLVDLFRNDWASVKRLYGILEQSVFEEAWPSASKIMH